MNALRRHRRQRSNALNVPIPSGWSLLEGAKYVATVKDDVNGYIRALTSDAKPPHRQERSLRIGIVGLGAIGTIFFTKLGRVAIERSKSSRFRGELGEGAIPSLTVDGLVKPSRLDVILADGIKHSGKEHPQVVLRTPGNSLPASVVDLIAFSTEASGVRRLVACESPHVRIRALDPTNNHAANAPKSANKDEEERFDVVLVAVKAFDTASVLHQLRTHHVNLFKRNATFVLLQNGLGELPTVKNKGEQAHDEHLGDQWSFVNGVTFVGGKVVRFGEVLASGISTGITHLAPASIETAKRSDEEQATTKQRLQLLGEVLTAAGLPWNVLPPDEMKAILWKKLIVNATINPIASLLNAPNKSVGECEWSRHCVQMIVHEAFAVATKEGISLTSTEEELVTEVLQVASNTGTNICSMLADLRHGSRTEIDAITGQLLAYGKKHGVQTPVNAFVYELIKALEVNGYRKR